ncbi:MAG TPA: PD-(D/E)XK nuclease family protein [Candidatus Eisenbacteria bacterium]|nr:PD-(D/E)XK nuclease family protein [Candidatus Eisenbacteria bacterium]
MRQVKTPDLWVSHSSIHDYLVCPRAYWIRHLYRNPKTNNKVNLINPSLALGSVVHQVLEALSIIKVEDRLKEPLLEQYEKAWEKISGEKGGFENPQQELEFKNRGAIMINRVIFHPGPIERKAVKLVSPDSLPPRYYLSQEEGIILCGKIDWLEYIPENNSVHIIDFKTGLSEEKEDSLQLPIYALLVKNCQSREVSKISYWYLETDNSPKEMKLPDLEKSKEKILEIAREIREARLKGKMVCPKGGCFACKPLEMIVAGKATFVETQDYQDIFTIPKGEIGIVSPVEDTEPF